jgi:hypothetical protein
MDGTKQMYRMNNSHLVRAVTREIHQYACAAVFTITVGYLAERFRQGAIFNFFVSLIGFVGCAMQIASERPHVRNTSMRKYA